MTWFLLISAGLNLLWGTALLLLWLEDRRYLHVRLWAWSWILLGLGLALGPAMHDLFAVGPARDAQSLLVSTTLMGSLLLQIGGAMAYRGHALRLRLALPVLAAIVLLLAALGARSYERAVQVGALVLCLGAFVSAGLMLRGSARTERWVALCFIGLGLVHLSGPLLDALGRSFVTYAAGLVVQTALSLGLILLSVARAHEEARRQGERFTRLAEHSLQGLVVMREHRVLYANPAALKTFGHANTASKLDMLQASLTTHERETAHARHLQVLADPAAHVEWEDERLTADGRKIHLRVLSSHLEWDGAPAELLVMLDDTQRQRAADALRRQALHDELTDLPNRNFVVEQLHRMCDTELWVGHPPPFALLSADLDRFQLVNESLGHEAGDALLRAVARRLAARLPSGVRLARLGEDQFVLIAQQHADTADAHRLATQLLGELREPFAIEGAELFVHMSVGIALFPRDGAGATLLRAADAAMHRAKQTPGASMVFFDPATKRGAQTRLEVEQSLGRAIAAAEFHLEYQPKFRAGTRALCGFEALLRWQKADGQRVSPAEFIPAAERTGQIKALGELVVALASAQVRQWRLQHGQCPPVAINVSPLQFEDPLFVTRMLARLAEDSLPPGSIDIEITETAAIGHLDHVLPQLARLREAGVACALDDFGTGQSSLTMLRQLPISAMKLDRSMIDPLPGRDASAIVQASCVLGHALGLEIIAEGVETEEQAAAAEALGCTQLQGYLLGRPLSVAAAESLLSQALHHPGAPAQPPATPG